MRGLLFLVSLVLSAIPVLGYMAFDYTMSNRAARAMGESEIGFGAYVMGWINLVEIVGTPDRGAETGAMPTELTAMLPRPPEGWTTRALTPQDVTAVLGSGLKGEDLELAADALQENRGKGLEQARQAYVSPEGALVVFELVRYPDSVFTSFMAMSVKFELEMRTMAIPSQDFMTVRGFEVREVRLPAGSPVRAFVGDIGGQLHLRVTAPADLPDLALLPLFQTLHVPAMAADVVRPVPGMGEVPVIVLASALEEEERAAYEAEAAAARERAAAETARQEEEAKAASAGAAPGGEAGGAAEPGSGAGAAAGIGTDGDDTAQPATGDDESGDGETVVRRGVAKGSTPLPGTGGAAGFGGDGCRKENGRKVCGVGD